GAERPAAATNGGVSDQEVREFASVYLQLVTLQEQGSARVQAGEDAQAVATELQPRVQQVFEGSALTPERYDEIAERADQDESLRQRIEVELQRAQAREPA